MAISEPKVIRRTVTKKQWAKYVPVKSLSANLRKIAAALGKLPKDTRGKVTLRMEIGRPTK